MRGGHVRLGTYSSVRGAAFVACAVTCLGIPTAKPAQAQSIHVLLVGVGKYQSLKPAFQLTGPPNDVRLMKDVLEGDPFHVKPQQITVLTDWQKDKPLQPTRANIEREFARLATAAQKGDQVFILMGGHGSQQPADDDPKDFEPDGLDEIFLPSDVQGWDGSKGRVVNAIVDDEIRVWLDRIRKSGAFTWIAFDSCHSGTMIRGTPSTVERERQIRMEELVPEEARRKVRPAEASRGAPSAGQTQQELGTDAGDVVALYAAQPFETTPESGDPAYGLFTSTMTEVLKQARSPLTYRELAERITDRYRAMNRIGPTPMFEGTAADREVLGQKTWPDRPQWTLAHDPNKRLIVNAGRLNGLTVDSVLEVFPPAGTADATQAVGYVKVAEIRPLESVVESVAFNSAPSAAANRLVEGSRCRLVVADFGDMTLKVGLQKQRAGSQAIDDVETLAIASAPPAVAKAMKRLTEVTKGLAQAVDRASEADWFIRLLVDGRVVMVPASGLPVPAQASSAVKPVTYEIAAAIDDTFEGQLAANLTRLARARNLLAIAGAPPDQPADSPGAISLKVELLRLDSKGSGGGTPVVFGPDGRVLRVGDRVSFRITNTSNIDVDVTLLFVDANFSIVSLFPSRGTANNRLERGKSYTTPVYPVSGPLGVEQVVAIGVPASSPPVSFASLEQDPLNPTRGGKPASSPLGRLLKQAMDGEGGTRSLGQAELATHGITLLTWRTDAAAK